MAIKASPKGVKKQDYGAAVIIWRAPEFKEVERDANWFMITGVLAVLMIAWAIWQNTYSFAVVVALIAGIYYLTHKEKPKDISVTLTTNGIVAGDRFYAYSEIESFWIIFKPEIDVRTLNFHTKSGMVREVTLQLESQDPAEVRSYLSAHVYEQPDRSETFIEKVIRVLKL